MLIVIASEGDEVARNLVLRWAEKNSYLLTPNDLTHSGWSYQPGDSRHGTFVASGKQFLVSQLRGVVTRLTWIQPHELKQIQISDRSYIAAESNAFLVAWLSELSCPVINRPTPICLAGPAWRPEQWVRVATQLNIPCRPVKKQTSPLIIPYQSNTEVPIFTVTVTPRGVFGASHAIMRSYARQLATASGAELLVANFADQFGTPELLTVGLWPDVITPELADSLLDYFLSYKSLD